MPKDSDENHIYNLSDGEAVVTGFVFDYYNTLPDIVWMFNGNAAAVLMETVTFGSLQQHISGYTTTVTLYNPSVLDEGFLEGALKVSTYNNFANMGCRYHGFSSYLDFVRYNLQLAVLQQEKVVIQIWCYGMCCDE